MSSSLARNSRGIPRPTTTRPNKSEMIFSKSIKQKIPEEIISKSNSNTESNCFGIEYTSDGSPKNVEIYLPVNRDYIGSDSDDSNPATIIHTSTPIKTGGSSFKSDCDEIMASPEIVRKFSEEQHSVPSIFEITDQISTLQFEKSESNTLIPASEDSAGDHAIVANGAGDNFNVPSQSIVHSRNAVFHWIFVLIIFFYLYGRIVHLQKDVEALRDAFLSKDCQIMFGKEETGLTIYYDFWEGIITFLKNIFGNIVSLFID